MTRSSERLFALLVAVPFLFLGPARSANAAQAGVVVEEVSKGLAGEKADIRAGDVLLAWQRPANPPANPKMAEGTIESVFDWLWVEIEQGPRGAVEVAGERDGKQTAFHVPIGNWGIKVRPRFGDEALRTYLEGKAAVDSKQLEQGMVLWGEVVKFAESTADIGLALWMNLRIGDTWRDARRWKEAETAYELTREGAERATNVVAQGVIWDSMGRALLSQSKFGEAEKAYAAAMSIRENTSSESLSVARSLHSLGIVAISRGDLSKADAYSRHALAIQEKLAPGSVDLARSLNSLGNVAWQRGELATANAYHRRALAMRERVAPDSSDVAGSLNNLGLVANDRGELAAADAYHKRALAIDERLAPDSLDVSLSLNNLGNVAINRGDLTAAESYYERAFAIQEKLLPNSLEVARSLNNLGLVARDRGDLATAESHFRRALTIREKLAPGSVDLARSLNRLGVLARMRGDDAAAEFYHKRALAIREKLAPDGLDVSDSLNNLGNVAIARRELATAEVYHKRALAIKEKLAPDSLTVATSLINLGELARSHGQPATAEAYSKRALAIREKLAPDSLVLAESLHHLGIMARDRGDLTTGKAYLERALAIQEKLGPGSAAEAESLHDLGLVYRSTSEIRRAADHFRRSIEALEAQVGKLGGTQEVQAGFGAQFADYYRDYIDLLIELNQSTEAFHILERSRARTLLAMLAERDLVFAADLPGHLARERRLINAEYDRTQSAIARLTPAKDAAEIDRLLARLRELRDKREEIAQASRKASPHFASLHYPQPLDLLGARGSLDAGTLLLSYCVTTEKTFLFVVQPSGRPVAPRAPPISVFTFPIGESALREKVAAFRRLMQRDVETEADTPSALTAAGQELFETLVKPAHALIAASDRVLISPDGPLHTLPFAVLVQPPDRAQRGRYLIEWKPLHVVASATVYAELKKARRNTTAQPIVLAAFGDPKYPTVTRAQADGIANPEVRAAVRSGYALEPLPASRKEVEAIARLYAGRAAIHLGDEATEERAKAIGKGVRFLHFASHGLLDERFPLNSSLALTIPERPAEGQANGLLQAWEIFEQMRIDADLVTLSACETGLGKELGGEGLMGLTRAFQYAGARSVLASLWSVGDDSTAELMTHFYGYLKAGKTKDDALRTAQIEMIRTRRGLSHPFHWAAFQLIGDWK